MHPARCLAAALVAAVLSAGDAAPSAPPVVARLADGATLIAHWDASIFGKVLADPVGQTVRSEFNKALKEAEGNIGFNPLEALKVMKGAQLTFLGLSAAEQGKIQFRVDLGTFASKLLETIRREDKGLQAQVVKGADEAIGDDHVTFARFGTVLAIGLNTPPSATAPTTAAVADFAVDADAKRLVEVIASVVPESKRAQFDMVMKNMQSLLGPCAYRFDLVPEGIRERLTSSIVAPGSLPVDRTVLARLPATTLMTLAWGFDGKAYWSQVKQAMATAPAGTEDPLTQADAVLQMLGIQATAQELVEGLTGTCLIALSQGVPFPSLTIALPRSKVMDQLLGMGLGQIGGQLPDEGQVGSINLPNVPLPISLLRDKAHWVVTMDAMLASSWAAGTPGGFADTPMARTLYTQAPVNACLLGASDTPAVLRTVQGYLGLILASAENLSPAQQQGINAALTKLTSLAATGYLYAGSDAKGLRAEVRGLVGSGLVPGIVGSYLFARPDKSRTVVTSATPDAAVIERLSGQLFTAQFQFQGGAYCDQNGNGMGEYGTLAELTGKVAAPGRAQAETLVEGFAESATIDGYTYAIFLPDGKGGALVNDQLARSADKSAATAQEKRFVIYAWPTAAEIGTRMFALDQAGIIYEQPATGQVPSWNALYDGKGWDQTPSWQPAQR